MASLALEIKNEPPTIKSEPPPMDVISKAALETVKQRTTQAKKPVVSQVCEVCNIELVGQAVIDAHMAGSKHAKKVRAQDLLRHVGPGKAAIQPGKVAPFRCEACDITLNSSAQLEVHYAGNKHKAKVGKKNDILCNEPKPAAASIATASAGSGTLTPPKSQDLHCAVCNIIVNSQQQLEQHLSSRKHHDRESGRRYQRASPYFKPSPRGGRGGLGSHGRGGKSMSANFTTLSNSFKSAGYSNSFIKPEGGVIMPKNPSCDTNAQIGRPAGPYHHQGNQHPSARGQPRNKGGFGSLTPYINSDGHPMGMNTRGGFIGNRGGFPRGGWHAGNGSYGPSGGFGDSGNYGYGNYGSYNSYGSYDEYHMMHAGPPAY